VIFNDVGMEGSAKFVSEWVEQWLKQATGGRVQLQSVECRENDKNSAIYFPG
jgi:6-pyruvoyltetrahydropterin/6-carboxytetrahydropterin synthase